MATAAARSRRGRMIPGRLSQDCRRWRASGPAPPAADPLSDQAAQLLEQLAELRRLLATSPRVEFLASPLATGQVLISLQAAAPITVESLGPLLELAERGAIRVVSGSYAGSAFALRPQ